MNFIKKKFVPFTINPFMVRPFEVISDDLPSYETLSSNKIIDVKRNLEADIPNLISCSSPQNPTLPIDFICTTGACSDDTRGEHTDIKAERPSLFTSRLPALRGTVVPANEGTGLSNQSIMRFSPDDSGNADVFTHYYGDVVRFNCDTGNFHLWNKKAWIPDTSNEVAKMAGSVMEQYRSELSSATYSHDTKLRSQFVHATSSCNLGRINALVGILKNRHSVNQSVFDTHPHLLNVDNGIVDLRTGDLQPHKPDLMLSKLVKVWYAPSMDYTNSLFYRFIRSICENDEGLMHYLQTAFGYGITGDVKEHVMFFLRGAGSNGKTTLLEAISSTVGSLLYHLPIGVLISANDPRGGCKHTSELVPTATARMVIASELNESDYLNEGRVKNLTGGSTITLREAYGKCFESAPSFKIFLDTNYLPKIRGVDDGIWRRVRVIPFNHTFRGEEINKQLLDKLKQPYEQQAVLFWLIQGAVTYYREGLKECEAVQHATTAYRLSEDTVGSFLRECVEMALGSRFQASALYTAYVEFCAQNDLVPESNTRFGRQLNELGYKKARSPKNNVYLNINLKLF